MIFTGLVYVSVDYNIWIAYSVSFIVLTGLFAPSYLIYTQQSASTLSQYLWKLIVSCTY